MSDEDDSVGFYAYETKRRASATLRLDERCSFFAEAMLRMVEQALAERRIRQRTGDFLSDLERELMHSGDGGEPRAAQQLSKPSPGRVAVGMVGDDGAAARGAWSNRPHGVLAAAVRGNDGDSL